MATETRTSDLSADDQERIDEFIDRLWLEDGLSKNTLVSYRQDLTAFATWLSQSERRSLLETRQSDVQLYLAVRFPQSKPRSISRLVAVLRRYFRFALREGLITIDPTLQIASPKLPRTLPKSLNEEEVESLLKAPDISESLGVRDRAMLELLY